MKKASATVLYKGSTNQIYYLALNYKNNLIPMINYSREKVQPYKYPTFNAMYKTVLNFAKNNGFYYASYKEFNCTWYDIQWIDIENPEKIEKYGFKTEKK